MDKDKAGLRVVKVIRENHDVTSLYFSGPEMDRFRERKAGQFASIRVLRDGAWSEPHPFTLSCAPEDASLRMTIKNSGAFTGGIPEIAPGTPIRCAGPLGSFCADVDSQPEIVMIAGGVGITPFLSVLRHFERGRRENSVVLFWANKTPRDAFAGDELAEMTRALKLTVVHAFSRVPDGERRPAPDFDDGRPGRIFYEYGRIDGAMLARHIENWRAAFYLCGPPAMQEKIVAELAQRGVPAAAVQKEAFIFNGKNLKS